MKEQTFILLFLCNLLLISAESSLQLDTETFVVDFMNEDIKDVQRTANLSNSESVKIVIENNGYRSEDVAFDAFLPSKAEIISFSASTDQRKYVAKKTNHKNAQKLLEKAKIEDSNAAIYKPQYYDNKINVDDLQISSQTSHIRPQQRLTFDLEYNSNLKSAIGADVKLLDEAVIIVDLFGENPTDLRAELYSPVSDDRGYYPNLANIAWLIRTEYGHKLSLDLMDVDIEECCDQLIVYDGANSSSSVLALVSGQGKKNANNYRYESKNNTLMVVLKSDCINSGRGFRGLVNVVPDYPERTTTPSYSYTTTTETEPEETTWYPDGSGGDWYPPSSECSGIQLNGSGRIYSPNYPYNYDNDLNCSWEIRADYGNQVQAYVHITETERCCDYIRVYDGSASNHTLIESLSGTNHTEYFTSTSNYMYIEFTTDYSVTRGGFYINYYEF